MVCILIITVFAVNKEKSTINCGISSKDGFENILTMVVCYDLNSELATDYTDYLELNHHQIVAIKEPSSINPVQ